MTQGYLSGQFDEVSIIYTQFVSMLTQTPTSESLLPLKPEAERKREDLSLRYNRARQGAITQEITEIVAGAEH